jgi:hypothetical protein
MDNAQTHNICINVPSSQTFISYLRELRYIPPLTILPLSYINIIIITDTHEVLRSWYKNIICNVLTLYINSLFVIYQDFNFEDLGIDGKILLI